METKLGSFCLFLASSLAKRKALEKRFTIRVNKLHGNNKRQNQYGFYSAYGLHGLTGILSICCSEITLFNLRYAHITQG